MGNLSILYLFKYEKDSIDETSAESFLSNKSYFQLFFSSAL